MTEMAKTFLFVAAAALALLVATTSGPSTESDNLEALVGTRLNSFEVDSAKRLRIIKFDKATASTKEFEVAENEGLWTIPSKQGYPADAARQMGEAVTCLIDREVLRIAAQSALEHEDLGVIDPGASQLNSKAQGVGIRVTITDSSDASLTDMIIGKRVKDAEGQYYVRNVDQDVVFVVNLDPEKLSTKFEDWIEDDLLQLNPMDIRQVNIKDYSAALQPVLTGTGISMQVSWERRSEMTLNYDQQATAWQAEQLLKYDPAKKELVPFTLAENETFNDDALSGLLEGLDDLLLVDVNKKPSELSADLKGGEDFMKDADAVTSLMERGFAPLTLTPGGEPEILSTEGEILCTLSDGVEYVLRFGNLQVESESTDEKAEQPESGQATEDDGINRYLFVMARFNESMLEKPVLEELPELPAADETDTPSEETATDAMADAGSEQDSTSDSTADLATQEVETEAKGDAAKTDAETETAASAAPDTDSEQDDAQDKGQAELIAQREAIEQDNQRKLDEYQEQVAASQQRVAELNERFGDWYYVIANTTYKKIHLSREEVLLDKPSDTPAAGTANPAAPQGIPGLPNLPN
jgi:hypothetical protein